jgi:hypothetical protein
MEVFMDYTQFNGITLLTNKLGDKVEQKQSRAIKTELTDLLTAYARTQNIEVMYAGDSPVMVFDNGLIVGFDFNVKALDTELSVLPVAKPKKAIK